MAKNSGVYYHSIAQERARESSQKDKLPGLSRLHHDSTGQLRGVWLSDELAPVLEANHGLKQSDEVIGSLKMPDGREIVVHKPIAPIIMQVEGITGYEVLPHIIDPHQWFYVGDLDWRKVKKFLVKNNDAETEEAARQLVTELQAKRGLNVEVDFFDPLKVIQEGRRETIENKISLNDPFKDKERRY